VVAGTRVAGCESLAAGSEDERGRATVRTVGYGDLDEQVLDVWDGAPDRPLVVFVHGGFWRPAWDRGHAVPLAGAIAAAGFPTVLPEYRRVPGRPDLSCADLRAALVAAAGHVAHDGTVVLVGHSAGGHLVLWAAATCPPPGLVRTVGLAPVADLVLADRLRLGDGAVRAFLGGPGADRPDLDPVVLPTPTGQVVLVVGDRDSTVPAALARSYAGAHPAAEIAVLAGTDHMDLVDPAHRCWPAVLAALSPDTGARPGLPGDMPVPGNP
jgi:acetyl esterase/lipase